ncbi:uncharacterized protein MONOS_12774 [Monocercomonoides exilis]|uniref:uncharacterized protein n=1 Tax=Monocercomonoides exilis TaxID=2049356 RepID=UPI00355ABA60|nr:hypothetical protein MONOS_12774 [Monocercomonoides exilis]|eukprot:MONOS_12774.1-p1 / transcript=MONOS_12774.1 / gene=MONOS_12774 / organism=Monocercomonoides_exilis_PA203 / gene_product=unspecified product / transcript_product=unspecified product / location=Mono_scaffold00731:30669-32519(+) / protein_length=617 / sequence_SO=supercontig / SO=protein_coding / is_pseudo=false
MHVSRPSTRTSVISRKQRMMDVTVNKRDIVAKHCSTEKKSQEKTNQQNEKTLSIVKERSSFASISSSFLHSLHTSVETISFSELKLVLSKSVIENLADNYRSFPLGSPSREEIVYIIGRLCLRNAIQPNCDTYKGLYTILSEAKLKGELWKYATSTEIICAQSTRVAAAIGYLCISDQRRWTQYVADAYNKVVYHELRLAGSESATARRQNAFIAFYMSDYLSDYRISKEKEAKSANVPIKNYENDPVCLSIMVQKWTGKKGIEGHYSLSPLPVYELQDTVRYAFRALALVCRHYVERMRRKQRKSRGAEVSNSDYQKRMDKLAPDDSSRLEDEMIESEMITEEKEAFVVYEVKNWLSSYSGGYIRNQTQREIMSMQSERMHSAIFEVVSVSGSLDKPSWLQKIISIANNIYISGADFITDKAEDTRKHVENGMLNDIICMMGLGQVGSGMRLMLSPKVAAGLAGTAFQLLLRNGGTKDKYDRQQMKQEIEYVNSLIEKRSAVTAINRRPRSGVASGRRMTKSKKVEENRTRSSSDSHSVWNPPFKEKEDESLSEKVRREKYEAKAIAGFGALLEKNRQRELKLYDDLAFIRCKCESEGLYDLFEALKPIVRTRIC